MKNLKTLSAALFVISLSACETLPEEPDYFQYGLREYQLHGYHNKRDEERLHQVTDPEAQGAQCFFIDDYEKIQDWIREVKEIARRRCQ